MKAVNWFAITAAMLILFSESASARAQGHTTINFMAPPQNFELEEPQNPPPPGGPFPYSFTREGATWGLVNWNIPNGNLSPFEESQVEIGDVVEHHEGDDFLLGGAEAPGEWWKHVGSNLFPFPENFHRRTHLTEWDSRAPESQIKIIQFDISDASEASLTPTIYRLRQTGAYLPCTNASGNWNESDLFASPNKINPPTGEQQGWLVPRNTVSVANLTSLVLTSRTAMHYRNLPNPTPCGVSQGSPLVSVILNNITSHQTLFYQLGLSTVCGDRQPAARETLCHRSRTKGGWFSQVNPYGIDDYLPAFGLPELGDNESRLISVDILPHLQSFIAQGAPGMDRDPSHWTIGSYYNGQHIWGDIAMETSWSDVSMVGTTN